MNIGDKYLKMTNSEDVATLSIFTIDDIFEISPRENVYECTMFKVKYHEKITQFQN